MSWSAFDRNLSLLLEVHHRVRLEGRANGCRHGLRVAIPAMYREFEAIAAHQGQG